MRCVAQWNKARFINKRFGKKDVEAVLQKLDQLVRDEAWTTAGEILKVVHGLVQNMNAVIDGEKTRFACRTLFVEHSSL
jgi:hypothetical protein